MAEGKEEEEEEEEEGKKKAIEFQLKLKSDLLLSAILNPKERAKLVSLCCFPLAYRSDAWNSGRWIGYAVRVVTCPRDGWINGWMQGSSSESDPGRRQLVLVIIIINVIIAAMAIRAVGMHIHNGRLQRHLLSAVDPETGPSGGRPGILDGISAVIPDDCRIIGQFGIMEYAWSRAEAGGVGRRWVEAGGGGRRRTETEAERRK